MSENKNKHEIDAKQILDMLIKHWWIILIAALVLSVAAFGYTELTSTDTYTSNATLLINGDSSLSSYQQILMGQYQSKDYPYILKSLDTLDAAAQLLNETEAVEGKQYTGGALLGMVSYASEEDSRIFRISVTSTDPEEARIIASKIIDAFTLKVNQHTDNKVTVKVVESPRTPTVASTANVKRNVLIGALSCFVLGCGIAVILGMSADMLDSEDWLHETYKDKVPLLASVPNSSASGGKSYYRYKYKRYYNYYTEKSEHKEGD